MNYNDNKKVLIIGYFFYQNIIGAVRLRGLAKFLGNYGWEPIILTTKSQNKSKNLSHIRVIETPVWDLAILWRKRLGTDVDKSVEDRIGISRHKNKKTIKEYIKNFYLEFFAYPDRHKGWYEYAFKAGDELIESEKIDAIISTSPPVTCHIVAKDLKQKHGIPWVADLRDLWSQYHYYPYSRIRRLLDKRLEFKTLSASDALTTVSKPFARELEGLHKTKDIYVIPNGFDPDEKSQNSDISKKFYIVHTGKLHRGKRDPTPFFEALNNLIARDFIDTNDLIVEFYGPHQEWLETEIKNFGLHDFVKSYNVVPREEILKKQKEAQLLLLFTGNTYNEIGVIPAKVFEYFASQRPILSVGTSGSVVNRLLSETEAGKHVSNSEEIEDALMKYYSEFKSKGKISYRGIDSEIEKYTHKEMSKKFANVLNTLER